MATIKTTSSLGTAFIFEVDVNPSLTTGTSAPIGSFAMALDGSGTFYKYGSSDTQWEQAQNLAQLNLPLTKLYNVKFISGTARNCSIGDNDIYTVPTDKKAFVFGMCRAYNPSAGSITFFPELKVSGTYYRAGSSLTITTGTGTQTSSFLPTSMVMIAGDTFSINTATTAGLNITCIIIEFESNSNINVARILGLANGDNTLYTVTSGKSAYLTNNYLGAIPAVSVVNGSVATINYILYNVPSAGSVGTTNQFFPSTAQLGNTGASFQVANTMASGDFIVINASAGTARQIAWVNYTEL